MLSTDMHVIAGSQPNFVPLEPCTLDMHDATFQTSVPAQRFSFSTTLSSSVSSVKGRCFCRKIVICLSSLVSQRRDAQTGLLAACSVCYLIRTGTRGIEKW